MARDGLFFRSAGVLNTEECRRGRSSCKASGRRFWFFRAPYDPASRAYGNLYSQPARLRDLRRALFYILTIAGVFRLRRTQPNADRPYRAFGYPVIPALYIVGAATILAISSCTARRRRGRG